MSEPVKFLTALSHALSTLGLYGEGHPAVRRAAEAGYRQLCDLQQERPSLAFTFLTDEVMFGRDLLPELERWEWSARFAQAGIERLEITGAVTEPHFERFLAHAATILGLAGDARSDLWQDGPEGIRFGRIRIDDTDRPAAPTEPLPVATLGYSLREEREAVGWVHEEVSAGNSIPLLEAYGVVRSLSLAMHGESRMLVPLLELRAFDEYTTTHSLNVSVLTMALAERMGIAAREVRTFGVAGLLHDLGKVRVPIDILNKPGKLTDEEREVMQRHPADGARIILTSDRELDLAATVAYEHHIMIDGGGYPRCHFHRACHAASLLVHVCDVYDALRTHRPYRGAWESERVLAYIEERAGSEFEPEVARKFVEMMKELEGRVQRVAA